MKVRNSILGIIALVTLCVIGCKKDPLFDTTEITTKQVTTITGSSAVSGGEITSDGFPTISQRGVCYGTSHEPTMNDRTAIHPNGGLGSFSVTMTDLSENTTYYVRAFAWNSTGAIYGEEYSFTTPYKPILSTLEVEDVTSVSCICGGDITDDGNATITQRGLCWSTHENPTLDDPTTVVDSVGIGIFKSEMTKLTPGTLYYVRAYATNAAGTTYGDVQQFTTLNVPVLKATEFANVTQETVVCSGSILDNAGAEVTEQGFCWGTTSQPTIENEKITAVAENGLGDFSTTISGLQWGTTYYVRSYATNSVGTAYGDETSFTTWDVPTVSKPNATTITAYTITCENSILFDGGTPITEKGLCWSTSANPTIENNKLQIAEGEETFSGTIIGLTRGTIYYIRAYAKNVVGTNYGEEIAVTTHTLATVSTITPSDITSTSAMLKGNVTADGGTAVIERGVCWSTSTSPTVSDNKQSVGSGTGTIKANITGLNYGVTYYVRAYAINSVGINYGKQLSFTTEMAILPTVTTTAASNIKYTKATLGGNVTSDGGATVTERGVCWSTSTNPTILDNKEVIGSGTGSFSAVVTNLTGNTRYYVRAYAKNAIGITYGEQIRITTNATPYTYYSGDVRTKESFLYGRFEVRMKVAYAPGCVSGMFLYYNNSEIEGSTLWNEIDIDFTGKDSQRFQSNIITGRPGAQITSEQTHTPGFVLNSDYHVYSIEWTPEYVAWLVDGVELRKTKLGANKEQVEALIKEQSLGFDIWQAYSPNWAGTFSPNNIPVTQYIDYVKVYTYNVNKKTFSQKWIDNFDSFNSNRWEKHNYKRSSSEYMRSENVEVKDGILMIHYTKEYDD